MITPYERCLRNAKPGDIVEFYSTYNYEPLKFVVSGIYRIFKLGENLGPLPVIGVDQQYPYDICKLYWPNNIAEPDRKLLKTRYCIFLHPDWCSKVKKIWKASAGHTLYVTKPIC